MSFDRNNLPPPVREIMEKLEASGATVHVARIEIPTTEPRGTATTSEMNSRTSSPASDESEGFVDTLVEIVRDGLQHLHNHLCPRIKENKQRIETLEREARVVRQELDEIRSAARRELDELRGAVLRLQGEADQRNAKIG